MAVLELLSHNLRQERTYQPGCEVLLIFHSKTDRGQEV